MKPKPCPFCNSEPATNEAEGPDDHDVCWCETKNCPIEDYVCGIPGWNTRTDPARERLIAEAFIAGHTAVEICNATELLNAAEKYVAKLKQEGEA